MGMYNRNESFVEMQVMDRFALIPVGNDDFGHWQAGVYDQSGAIL